jgi:hypothetical protein
MNDDKNAVEREAGPEQDVEPQLKSALEKLSRDKPGSVTEIFSMMGVGPAGNPLHRKMTENHITQVLDLASQHDEREYNLHKAAQEQDAENGKSSRRYVFATFIVVAMLVALILILFKDKPDVLVPILTGFGGLVGGFLGGFGYGQSRSD